MVTSFMTSLPLLLTLYWYSLCVMYTCDLCIYMYPCTINDLITIAVNLVSIFTVCVLYICNACVYMWPCTSIGQRSTLGILLWNCLLNCLGAGSPIEHRARLVASKSQECTALPRPQCWGDRHPPPCQASYVGARIWTVVLMLLQQASS